MNAAAPVKACLFDMGNVLVFIDERRKERRLAEEMGLPVAIVHRLLVDDGLQARYEGGEISRGEFVNALQVAGVTRAAAPRLIAAFCDMFRPNDAMPPMLHALLAHGARLILVSNTNDAHVEYLTPRLPALAFFEQRVMSHQIKALKPALTFYLEAAARAGCPPEEALFIDDVAANIEGARAFGFQTHLFTPSGAGQIALAARLIAAGLLPSVP